MSSNRHQFILGLVIKKMREVGVTIYGIDGSYPGLFGEKIKIPPQILRHRPDAIGTRNNGQVCIGEAKTENDLANARTHEQLQDFASIKINGQLCELFIGIPKSSEDVFRKVLEKTGLKDIDNLYLLCVPDELIND
ncbi:MAG TPA: hypothetical protein ACFYD9_02905 [Candidatus Wunengus sp. YC64]|uniref:hypothetical protein n=1 Tax=Candidatus Wunengus sp. YC64 TaxID=3367700 RepID=UPI00402992BB